MDINKWVAQKAKANRPNLKVGQSVTYYTRVRPWKEKSEVVVISRLSKHRFVIRDTTYSESRKHPRSAYLPSYRTIAMAETAVMIQHADVIYRKVVK